MPCLGSEFAQNRCDVCRNGHEKQIPIDSRTSEKSVYGILGPRFGAFVPNVAVHRLAAVHEHDQVDDDVHDGDAAILVCTGIFQRLTDFERAAKFIDRCKNSLFKIRFFLYTVHMAILLNAGIFVMICYHHYTTFMRILPCFYGF
jgi:hypothetical protein